MTMAQRGAHHALRGALAALPRTTAMRRLYAAILALGSAQAFADDGHDHHQPVDPGAIGAAHLDTSCNAAAQKEIDRGVALIHSFWYPEAEKAFRRAADADARCAMAWWGVAMSNLHPLWTPPTPDEMQVGVTAANKAQELGAKTPRERAYIGAIHTFYSNTDTLAHAQRMAAYERAMANVAKDNPQDREASIFHALALLGVASPNDKTYAKQKQAAGILNRVLPEAPEHPGVAHYLIHSFDYPELAELALPAARVYAKLAPGSPHALHMPSHIFTRLGLWEESIASNQASAEKARRHDSMKDELHAIDYLVYAHLQRGDDEQARQLVAAINAISASDKPVFQVAYAIAAAPARYALERRQWREAAALSVLKSVDWTPAPYAEANIHFARGVGAARAGDLAIAHDAHARLAAIRQTMLDRKDAYWADQVEIQRLAVAAWIARAENDTSESLRLMQLATDLEAKAEKHPVTPGAIIPAREQLAEMLLIDGRGKEAQVQVQLALKDAPNRRNALRLAHDAGRLAQQ